MIHFFYFYYIFIKHMSVRVCGQCKAVTRKKSRCRLRTCTTGPYCWLHTKSLEGLRVKPSALPIAGKGLYTVVPRAANSVVGDYTGEYLSKKELNRRYPGDTLGEYVYKVRGGKRALYIDSRDTNSGVLRYMNTCDAPVGAMRPCRNNVYLRTVGNRVVAKMCKNAVVNANDELYTSYGPGFPIGGRIVVAGECM
jgi:hypothetical protein